MLYCQYQQVPHTDSSVTNAAFHSTTSRNREPLALYRHYKGGLYRIESGCKIEADGAAGLLYRSIDPYECATLWMRPSLDFHAEVGNGQTRFTRIRNVTDAALREALSPNLVSPTALDDILSRYDEPWRFYHTREHLFEMFEHAKRRNLALSHEQKLAILFHDIVYVPGAKPGVNEAQSAALALTYKGSINDKVDWAVVGQLIEATAHHKTLEGPAGLVCGLDLACLASAPHEFAAGTELIWLEYRHLLPEPDARKTFDTERLKFLLNLASADSMFCKELADLEEAARLNIEALRQAWLSKYTSN